MREAGFEARYDPTFAEIQRGMALISRAIYSGRWRVAAFAFSVLRGTGYGVLAALIAIMSMHNLGIDWVAQPLPFYGLFGVFVLGMFSLQRVLHAHLVRVYLGAPQINGQRLRLDPRGIGLDNGRSQSFFDWQDVPELIVDKRMMVARHGNQGLVIPERLFAAQGGDTGELREQVQAWHAAAQDGKP